jgi:hypothetical protein
MTGAYSVLSIPHVTQKDRMDPSAFYIAADGRTGHNPLELAELPLRFSLSKLALALSSPALTGEFLPDCPWVGVSRIHIALPWPQIDERVSHVEDIEKQFRQSISDEIGPASVVAVALSGGLDSLAVLYYASQQCQVEGRRLIAVTADLVDDAGNSSAAVVRQLIDQLGFCCELRVVEWNEREAKTLPKPAWHPDGPLAHAMPGLCKALRDRASEAGAHVMLSGSGADELLGAVRFLLPRFVQKRRWRDATTYLRDIAAGGGMRRVSIEGLAALSAQLPARLSMQLYWAANWPELCRMNAPAIVADAFSQHVEQWTTDWVRSVLRYHCNHHEGKWATADAWDALFPIDLLAPTGSLIDRYPFMNPTFARYVMGLPLEERYSADLHTPYHRRKALVLRLFPSSLHAVLPRSKQIFSHAFARYQRATGSTPERCLAHGLILEERLEACDATHLHRINALEQWIIGAERIGATAVP